MNQIGKWSRFRYGILLFALGITLGTAAAAQAASGPEVGPNIQVNDPQQLPPNDWPNRNTPSLAASEDGQSLVAVFEDFQGFCGFPNNRPCPAPVPPGLTSFAFSTDGGTSWTDGGALPPIGAATTVGHPWIDRGGQGEDEVYYAVSRMRIGLIGLAGIGIYRGHFAAGTFVWDDSRIINSANPNDQYSRPVVAAAKDGSGKAYVALSNVLELCGIPSFGFGQIEVWRTHDAGATWQGPVVAGPDTAESSDPNDPLCGTFGPIQVAPAISLGPQGEVYVVWQKGPRLIDALGTTESGSSIAFARSLDGGVSFDPPQTLVTINANYQNTPVGHGKSRQNDQPRIAAATTGRHHGRVYVTFYQPVAPVLTPTAVQSLTSAQIFITHSDDQGATWSSPQELAPPVPPTGVKRMWPTVSVRPGGDVDVVFLESRETQATPDPTDIECNMPTGAGRRVGLVSSLVDTWWIQSRDGGATWSLPLRISEQTSNWCSTFYTFSSGVFSNYGDYLGTASAGNRTFVLWPDGSRNGVTDLFFAEVKGKTDK
ncbi:MAG TPA: sialidase family protein [Thermoanaerobaculia bacterium]|nr:sialidase family protein [Thermoanaerobaculia bacterium]